MPKFTDLPKWKSLSKDERDLVKKYVGIKSYMNFDGKGSISLKELKKGEDYQEEING